MIYLCNLLEAVCLNNLQLVTSSGSSVVLDNWPDAHQLIYAQAEGVLAYINKSLDKLFPKERKVNNMFACLFIFGKKRNNNWNIEHYQGTG